VAKKKKTERAPRKRKRGRPHASQVAVGSEGIIAAARKLLEIHLPHLVSMLMIAQKAGVDPALVRYYFKSREELFFAVAENIVTTWVATHTPPPDAAPAQKLEAQIRGMVDSTHSVRSMQRLMIDECAEAESPLIRARVQELNARAVKAYAEYFDQSQTQPLVAADPLLAYVAVIGMADFFASAQSMIVPLLPKKLSADELAERYKNFIVEMVLNGLRPRGGK
jgi:AcrR family transcriptional regulator